MSISPYGKKILEGLNEEQKEAVTYGDGPLLIVAGTFHAFGDRVLRENALEIGLPPDFQVLSVPEQIMFFREHLFEFPLSHYRPLGNPTRHIEAILNFISRAKDEDITPEEYLNLV